MEFVHCSYLGQHSADGRRFHGLGRYTFANGDVYLGGVLDGQFHGNGVIFFSDAAPAAENPHSSGGAASAASPIPPAGDDDAADDALNAFLNPDPAQQAAVTGAVPRSDGSGAGGQYRGVWEYGRHVSGNYVFHDGLVYGSSGGAAESTQAARQRGTAWTYCHGSDRRLWEEYLQNVAPVLPHEALLGGARLLHDRKQNTSEEEKLEAARVGEGLPMVLPRAFVHARAAPAFAKGQLTGMDDPRVLRWTAAATATAALEDAARREWLQRLQDQLAASLPTADAGRRPTEPAATDGADVRTDLVAALAVPASPELVESSMTLCFAMAIPTEGLRADGRLDEDSSGSPVAKDADGGAAVLAAAAAAAAASASPKKPTMNLTVCRVVDVEDVNRTLVQIVAAP